MQKSYSIDIQNQESTSGVDAKKFALWAGLASIVMFFIVGTWAVTYYPQ